MSRTDRFVFQALHIIAWIIFVGISIEAGGLLVNFFFSIFKPDFLDRLYQKLDITSIYETSKWTFFSAYSFMLSVMILKAYLFYMVIQLMQKIDLSSPFNADVSRRIARLSYMTLAIGFLGQGAMQFAKTLMHHGIDTSDIVGFWSDSAAFILMGAVIYIIAVIFKRGVAIQQENELTV